MAVLLPGGVGATIWCDSKAALAIVRKMQSRDVESRRKSSLASIAQFFVQPIRQRLEPLMLKWIRGHKENEGNEVTDTVAKVAQQKQEGWWMRSLGTMPDQRFQVCAGRDIAPYKMGGIVKRQEEAIT
ncbi:hypothetical protein IWW38_005769, partial [Coemansia aciculifera]